LQLLETSSGQQEEVLAYIEKKKKKRGMVRGSCFSFPLDDLHLII
jgi:hypothetical protein